MGAAGVGAAHGCLRHDVGVAGIAGRGHAGPALAVRLRDASRVEVVKRDILVAIEQNGDARETFRAQYRAFTVDEYQDVNLLQQSLLDLWLGERDDLCVVGDDYQSIYSFTGASPEHLLGVPKQGGIGLLKQWDIGHR